MIHVLDVLGVRPGEFAAVERRVREELVPLLTGHGLRHAQTWMYPAVELIDQPTELLLLWELDGVGHFWQERLSASADPLMTQLFAEIDAQCAYRNRKVMTDPRDASIVR